MRCGKPAQCFMEKADSLLATADLLESVLIYLRFEGEVGRGKNLKRAYGLLAGLQEALRKRFGQGERNIFPYLKRHIPRLEHALNLLCWEQGEVIQRLESFERQAFEVQKLEKAGRQRKVLGLYRDGVYMAYMIRHCLKVERDLIKASVPILQKAERQQLDKWLARA